MVSVDKWLLLDITPPFCVGQPCMFSLCNSSCKSQRFRRSKGLLTPQLLCKSDGRKALRWQTKIFCGESTEELLKKDNNLTVCQGRRPDSESVASTGDPGGKKQHRPEACRQNFKSNQSPPYADSWFSVELKLASFYISCQWMFLQSSLS